MRSKAGKDKKTGATVKPPTQAEIKTAVKKAGEAQARLSLIANILRGPERDRYDHFLANGFPLWKGTDYYYNRYRPGLGTVMIGLFLVVGGGIHYLTLYMSWKRQKEFVERYIKFARDTAWGGGLNIPGVDAAPAPAPAPVPSDDEDTPPPIPQNRRERRMQEKAAKREGGRAAVKKTRRAPQPASGTATPDAAGPTGARRRVVAENGKILVVDSLGDVYLEEEDEEGQVNEFLLDVSCFSPLDVTKLTPHSPTSSPSPASPTPPSFAFPSGSSTSPPAASCPRRPRSSRSRSPPTMTTLMFPSEHPAPTLPARTLSSSTRAPTLSARARLPVSSRARPTSERARRGK